MATTITPQTHPDHPLVGRYFKSWAGPTLSGNAIYYCDSFDPAFDFLMTPITRELDGCALTPVSPRAIDRTFHTVHEDADRMHCLWGRLTAPEENAIRAHQAKLLWLAN